MPQLGRYDRELGAMNLTQTQRLPDCFPQLPTNRD
jgi:hypothetical protein